MLIGDSAMDLQTMTDATLTAVKSYPSQFAEKQAASTTQSDGLAWHEYRASVYNGKATIGLYDRSILTIQETQPSVFRFSMRDIAANRRQELSTELQNEAEMKNLIALWSDKIAWWASRLTSYRLQPNKQYQVLQDFQDYYGAAIKAGTKLSFTSKSFVPYHGGYTFQFAEMAIHLQEDDNADILSDFDLYFEEIP
jgi:hypothetical protein